MTKNRISPSDGITKNIGHVCFFNVNKKLRRHSALKSHVASEYTFYSSVTALAPTLEL